jgi:ribosomal protein S12 methylthiotransferase accessory factor
MHPFAAWLEDRLPPTISGRDIRVRPEPGAPETCTVLVAVPGEWTTGELTRWAHDTRLGGARFLPVRGDGATTIVGPVVGPDLPGCVECAEHARGEYSDGSVAEIRRGGTPPPTLWTAVAALIRAVVAEPDGASGRLWLLDGDDATITTHARPPCTHCASVPHDSPEGARFELAPRPVARPGLLRQANPRTGEGFTDVVLDPVFGPVTQLKLVDELPVPMVSAATNVGAQREWSYGRGETVAEAERIALFETIERRLGAWPHARRTVLRSTYAELGPDRAIDPVTLGLPDPTPYSPDVSTRWVHGWSVTRDRPVAVPEHVVYFRALGSADAPRFLDDSSNGCGLGNSPQEAALHALFELLERDAFLLAWYARTPLRRVAVPAEDDVTPHLVDRLDQLDYDLVFFDATTEVGLPVVVSLARQRSPESTLPYAYFSAGAHPDPATALRSAALEAAVGVCCRIALAAENETGAADRLRRMLADSTEVRGIEDHVDLHTLPEARSRYDFLDLTDEPQDWRELWPELPHPQPNLTQVLADLVTRLAAHGMETIVVDQTDRWTRDRLGLHAVKVIVPGTLPMTFGHANRRVAGLPRLLTVPAQLGRAPGELSLADLPLHPHPFP